ncbi:mRNA binding protein puf3, partial [Cryomyces antarcticus]
AIERVPAEHIQFIIHDITGQVQHLSTHSYGCRVIQRMLEHCEEPAQTAILQELHACGSALIPDQYGNYVTQHVIEHGKPEDRAKVIELVKAQLLGFSKHKFASNVVEKCLVHGTDVQRKEIMLQMGKTNERGESTLVMLIRDGYGNYVIQKLLDTLGVSDYALFMQMLQPDMVKAKRTASGKQVQAIEKKMHRFDFQSTYCHVSLPSPPASSENISTATTPPPLTSDVQSPESSSHASTNGDSIDGPVQGINRHSLATHKGDIAA